MNFFRTDTRMTPRESAVDHTDDIAHLQDVLHEMETAVLAILNAATHINQVIETQNVSPETKGLVNTQLEHMYAACSFQDLSGQRIQNVLQHLRQSVPGPLRTETPTDSLEHSLMNGPQCLAKTPTQGDIDHLFKSS